MTFPNSGAAMPPLPPKSVLCKQLPTGWTSESVHRADNGEDRFRSRFLEKRRAGLSYFLKSVCYNGRYGLELTHHSCILLNPEFSGSPVLKDFIFS